MKKIVPTGLFVGLILFLASMTYNWLLNMFLPGLAQEYTRSGIFRPWTDPLMSLYFVYPFVLGLVLTFGWNLVKLNFKGKDWIKRGWKYGIFYWIIASFPGMFISYSSFQVSLTLICSWTLGGLIESVVAGVLLAKLNP